MFVNAEARARRSERHEIVLPVRFRLTAKSRERVHLLSIESDPQMLLRGDLIDLSRGGVGFMGTHFIPKGTRLELRICGLDADPARALLSARIRVQRIRMTDSRPAYFIGGAFVESDEIFDHDLELLLNRLKADSGKPITTETGAA